MIAKVIVHMAYMHVSKQLFKSIMKPYIICLTYMPGMALIFCGTAASQYPGEVLKTLSAVCGHDLPAVRFCGL